MENFGKQLYDLIDASADRQEAVRIALEVIHAELERFLSAQESQLACPPAPEGSAE